MSNYPENWEKELDIRPEDYLVTDPVIDRKYHISWAKSNSMVWVLKGVVGNIAYLKTPKTNKPIRCKISELREINRFAQYKASKRPYLD